MKVYSIVLLSLVTILSMPSWAAHSKTKTIKSCSEVIRTVDQESQSADRAFEAAGTCFSGFQKDEERKYYLSIVDRCNLHFPNSGPKSELKRGYCYLNAARTVESLKIGDEAHESFESESESAKPAVVHSKQPAPRKTVTKRKSAAAKATVAQAPAERSSQETKLLDPPIAPDYR